jgi:Protein of unknown function (DUF2829)
VDFSDALQAVRQGRKARRRLWAELGGRVGDSIELAHPVLPDGRKIGPQLVSSLPDGTIVMFTGGSWDLLADDWEIAD